MNPMQPYEIFHKLPSKPPVWVETANSLEDAKKRWKELTLSVPGGYFILDWENSVLIIPFEYTPLEGPSAGFCMSLQSKDRHQN
jgi:hypothetical protein